MARSTQYIGLNKAARDYVENCMPLPSDTHFVGLCEEIIPLAKYECPASLSKREGAVIREVVQETPWSSGPMYFTCLEVDFNNGGKAMMYEWHHDPKVEGQYDEDTGGFWV